MRFWVAVIGLTGFPILVGASPTPPADFSGAQFVDKGGCVYSRQGSDWVPRRDPDGAQICGFPPTPGAQVQADDLDIEGRLAAVLAEGLRDGDLLADRRTSETRADPLPNVAQAEFDQRVARQVEVNEAAKVLAAGNAGPNIELCAKLGYQPQDQQSPIIGADVTQGLCPGMRAPLPERKTVTVASTTMDAPVKAEVNNPATTARPLTATPQEAGQRPAAPSANTKITDRRAPAGKATGPSVEMIPASARYVQVGAFADEANASIAIRKLSERGYRVAQSHIRRNDTQLRTVLAGPFRDRQSLIEALSDLRKNGYPRSVAR